MYVSSSRAALRRGLRCVARRALVALTCLSVSVASLGPAALGGRGGAERGDGDVYIGNAAAQGLSSTSGAILRLDPLTGTSSMFVDLFSSQQAPGTAVFDPYRQRVVFSAGINSSLDPVKLWFVDGSGALQDVGVGSVFWHSMSPTGDGRIYVRDVFGGGAPFKWLDAANRVHVLLDAAGTGPFWVDGLQGYDARGMIYDAGTNALNVPTSPISTNGGSGETPAMFEVPFDPCAGGWIAYGAGLAGLGGVVPALTGGGCPSQGPLFSLSLSGAAGAAPGALPPAPPLTGLSVYLQGAFADAAAVQGVSLTNGLELEIG